MKRNGLSSHIKQLELSLLSKKIRRNSEKLGELIDEDFTEIGKSGKIWTKQKISKELKNEVHTTTSISGFKIRILADDIVLVTYTARMKGPGNIPAVKSRRSSIWKRSGNKWKIIFHQGTLIK